MSARRSRVTRLVVPGVAGLLVLASASAGVAGGSVNVVVRKTVLITLGPDAKATSQRTYTQITATGSGSVQISDLIGPAPLRNLNGFAAPNVSNLKASYDLSVNGRSDRRTVQDFTWKLPIGISVAATLDGAAISPADVVGKTGLLKVTYTVTNTSGVSQTLQVPDGHGGTVAKDVLVPIPLVGTMATTLPASFAAVDAPGAAAGGDGHGGTLLSYTLLMFDPLGASTATLSYQAQLSNGSLPSVEFQFLPVAPDANPTTKSAQDQYQGGQNTGQQLTDGATTIDSNLLKLQAGAGQLLAGLQKLQAGATQLSDGLNGQAAPGARQLAGGLDQAKAGGVKLAGGASSLSSGLQLVNVILSSLGTTGYTEAGQPGSDLSKACLAASVTCPSPAVARVVATWAASQALIFFGSSAKGCDPTAGLVCGAAALAAGASQLLAGLTLLDAGSHTLSTGLDAAGSGAAQIAAGLGLAVPGGTQIHSGAGQLSALGTKKLIAAGVDTVSTFGQKYALMQALNARIAAGDGIPNGPATGTGVVTTGAYDFRLAAASRDANTNLIRLLLIVILFAGGLGLTKVLHRTH